MNTRANAVLPLRSRFALKLPIFVTQQNSVLLALQMERPYFQVEAGRKLFWAEPMKEAQFMEAAAGHSSKKAS